MGIICGIASGAEPVGDINLKQYIIHLRRKLETLESKLSELQDELMETARKLEKAEAVEGDYLKEYAIDIPNPLVDPVLRSKFSKLSIKESMVVIASESAGILDLAEARNILVKAGVFQNDRNAATSMSSILSRHQDLFKRLSKGTYRLEHTLLDEKERTLLRFSTPSKVDEFENPHATQGLEEYKEWKKQDGNLSSASDALKILRDLDIADTSDARTALMERFENYSSAIRHTANIMYQDKFGRPSYPRRIQKY